MLCAESVDSPGIDLEALQVLTEEPPTVRADGTVVVRAVSQAEPTEGWPYGDVHAAAERRALDVPLVPYNQWAERGPSTMRVWLPASQRAG